jgi:anti-sigma factor RsiW
MSECDRISSQLAGYVVGALRGRARARVEVHLRACAACRRELAALQRTGAILDAVPAESAPAAIWLAVQQQVLARPRLPRRWARSAWRLAMGGVALLLILVSAFVFGPLRSQAPVPTMTAEVDAEMAATMEDHLSAVWASPLADEAAVGLRLAGLEGG